MTPTMKYRNFLCMLLTIIFFRGYAFSQSPVPGNIQTIRCSDDSGSRYSLYLPTNYIPGNKYNLLIFLDPSARGDVPVEKYRDIGEAYGLVLAGSFDSKNFDLSSAEKSIPAIIADIKLKLSGPASGIWLGGFSGGSRMASAFAAAYGGVNGVIACGAGLAAEGTDFYDSPRTIPFAGIVGDRDMNFEEMVTVKETLTSKRKNNLLILFDGEHEWPPANQLSIAVQWLQQQSGFPATITGDKIIQQLTDENKRHKAAGTSYYSWIQANEYRKLPLLFPVADSLATILEAGKKFNSEKESFEAVVSEERNFMDQFSLLYDQAVTVGDIRIHNDELWNQKAAFIKELRNEKSGYKQLSAKRLFDFSWRLCTEQYFWLMETDRFRQAYCSAYILSFFEGTQQNPHYLMARAAAGFSDKELCLAHLKKALGKGLAPERMMKDTLITSLLDTKTLEKLSAN